MSNTQLNRDKGIIQNIGYKEFTAICDEYKIVETATKKLLEIANNPETKTRFKIDIYKWIVEMNIGKPKQMSEITLPQEDNKLSAGIIMYVDSEDELEALKNLKQEILDLGGSQEQIDRVITSTAKELDD